MIGKQESDLQLLVFNYSYKTNAFEKESGMLFYLSKLRYIFLSFQSWVLESLWIFLFLLVFLSLLFV